MLLPPSSLIPGGATLGPLAFPGWRQLLLGDVCRQPAKRPLRKVPGGGQGHKGARKCGGPGASTGDGTERRDTGCLAGPAQLEETAAPKTRAKTPEPAPCSPTLGTICEPARAPSALEKHSTRGHSPPPPPRVSCPRVLSQHAAPVLLPPPVGCSCSDSSRSPSHCMGWAPEDPGFAGSVCPVPPAYYHPKADRVLCPGTFPELFTDTDKIPPVSTAEPLQALPAAGNQHCDTLSK